ncbi:unnamed protein product [Polarella glacialis]|uniref:Uncharacterized protein n=1 Tax=Polarella glacialis TaxID=89957 RepID=A0A813GDM7_POLGL|nr:unnamed protein product [Polarella glacialis]
MSCRGAGMPNLDRRGWQPGVWHDDDLLRWRPWWLLQQVTCELKVVTDAGFHSCWLHATHFDSLKAMQGEGGRTDRMAMLKNMVAPHNFGNIGGVHSVLGSHDQIGDRHGGKQDGQGTHRYFVSRFGGSTTSRQCYEAISLRPTNVAASPLQRSWSQAVGFRSSVKISPQELALSVYEMRQNAGGHSMQAAQLNLPVMQQRRKTLQHLFGRLYATTKLAITPLFTYRIPIIMSVCFSLGQASLQTKTVPCLVLFSELLQGLADDFHGPPAQLLVCVFGSSAACCHKLRV